MTQTATATKEISLAQALDELVRVNKRIEAVTKDGLFVAFGKGANLTPVGCLAVKADEAKALVQSSWDSVSALLEYRIRLKNAIIKANAEVKVTVNGKEYTIAQAIDLKEVIKLKQAMLAKARLQQAAVITGIRAVQSDKEKALNALTSGVGTSEAIINSQKAIIEEQFQVGILEPSTGFCQKHIDDLASELSVIETDLRYALTVANATAKVTV